VARAIKNGVGLMRYRRRWDIAPAGELAEVPGEILLTLTCAELFSIADGIYPAKVRTGRWGRFISVREIFIV
jgi:hypothetical protein